MTNDFITTTYVFDPVLFLSSWLLRFFVPVGSLLFLLSWLFRSFVYVGSLPYSYLSDSIGSIIAACLAG